ncbi:MAG: WecB/TagA/CpsF family glycosyltransferase [Synechocystis sp.]|nr:WecB/TagA/CpsF family glycosyltransferase [Synechocystis sp.]
MNNPRVNILGTEIDNITISELLENLGKTGGLVVTPNVDHLIKLRKDQEFQQVYSRADYRICDSKIVQLASYFLGQPIQEKISGSDFFPAFYQYNAHNPNITIFLLGAQPGVAKIAQQKINDKVGRQIIVDVYSPPFGFEKDEAECQKIIDLIKQSGATVLAVGLGAPKQEKWLACYRDKLPLIKIFMAIGGTIDFEAGHIRRSPKWMSEMGLEWLFRLSLEPKRLWRRYLIESLPFVWLVLKQRFSP